MATRGDTVKGYENVHRYTTDDGREQFVAAHWNESDFTWPLSRDEKRLSGGTGERNFCCRIQNAPSFDALEEAAAQAVKWFGRA
jgi:hypothetical protein